MKFPEVKFFEGLGIRDSEIPIDSQDTSDVLASSKSLESEVPQNYEDLHRGDRWGNGVEALRIEGVDDGAVSVFFHNTEHGSERGVALYENIGMLRDMLRDGKYIREKQGKRQAAADDKPVEPSAETKAAESASKVVSLDAVRQAREDEKSKTDALIETIQTEKDAVVDIMRKHRKTLSMRRVNGWLSEDEEKKMTSLLDNAEIKLYLAIKLTNSEDGREEEALGMLRELHTSLDLNLSKEQKETSEQPREGSAVVVAIPEAAAVSVAVSPKEDVLTPEAEQHQRVESPITTNPVEKISPLKNKRRRTAKKASENPKEVAPAVAAPVLTENVPVVIVPEATIAGPDVDDTMMVNPFGRRTTKNEVSQWKENGKKLSDEIAQAVGSGDISQGPQPSESISVDTIENQDAQQGIKPSQEAGKEVKAESVVLAAIPEVRSETEKGEETLTQKIERLKTETAEMRVKYVKEDYENTNAWANLQKFFGKTIKGLNEREWQEKGHSDVSYWQAQYNNNLLALQDAELEKLKQDGLTGKALKEAMAGTLQYFKLDETINVVDARTQYRAENRGWGEKTVDALGAMGRFYNRLPLEEKFAITVALAAGTFLTVGTGGIAGGAVAATLMARKVFSGAGTFVGVEALLEERGKRSLAKKAKQETGTQMGVFSTEGPRVAPERDFEHLSTLLKQDIFALDEKLQSEKRAKFYRKAGAAVAGYAVGSGWLSQTIMQHLGGNEATTWVKDQITHHVAIESTPSAIPGIQAETAGGATVVAETPLSRETANILKEHALTSADGKRGLWGVIESRLPEDMPKADKAKAVAALERIIDQKLGAMSPEELKAAGFQSGDINRVIVGDTIKFDKVLSAQEIQATLSGNISQSDVVLGTNEAMAQSANGVVIEPETVDAQDLVDSAPPRVSENMSSSVRTEMPVKNFSGPVEFLREYPDKMPDFRRELGNFRMGIFSTPEVASMENYSYVSHGGELGNAKVVQVLADYHRQIVPNNALNPLHPSQMRHINDFVKASARNFGPVGYAKTAETVEAYTRRIAVLSLQHKMENPNFVFKF